MSGPIKIIYVDDEPDIRTIVEFALENEDDFALTLCASGPEAIETVKRVSPDLVLLDVMMPGMDGPTTLRCLRDIPGMAQLPIGFVTAKVQATEVAQLKSLGTIAVIAKPFDPMGLAAQLRELWEQLRHE